MLTMDQQLYGMCRPCQGGVPQQQSLESTQICSKSAEE